MRIFGLLALSLLLVTQVFAAEREIPTSNQQVMLSYAPLVKKVAPAVVNIYTAHKVREVSPLMSDPFFGQFFGGGGLVREREVVSLGSGVIINGSGLVITNNHVVKDSDQIKIVLSDRREYEAEVVLTDATVDLALLKLKGVKGTLPTLQLADSDNIEVGDMVLAIGNPFGVGQTVTSGIVSALARTTVGISDYQFFIQTDAAINPGNSGGALVDMQGRLLGINTAIYSRTGGSNGIGFAIPANMVATVIASQNGDGKVVRPWLGASFQTMTQDMADSIGIEVPKGVMIKATYPNGPAEHAGLKVGDVVLQFNGKDIADAQGLKFRIATQPLGHSATLNIVRNGKPETLTLTMEAPPETPKRDTTRIGGNSPLSGATIANLSPALANEIGFHEFSGAVVMQVAPNSKAGIIGFTRNDLILAVNNKKVTSVRQLHDLLSKPARNWLISFKRGDKIIEATLAR